MDKKLMLLVSFMLLVLVKDSYCTVECYQCLSAAGTTANCQDPFKSDGIPKVTCSYGCSKTKSEVNDAQYVQRDCSAGAVNDDCISASYQGAEGNICTCNGNLCNAAASFTVSLTGLVAIGVLTIFGKIMF